MKELNLKELKKVNGGVNIIPENPGDPGFPNFPPIPRPTPTSPIVFDPEKKYPGTARETKA